MRVRRVGIAALAAAVLVGGVASLVMAHGTHATVRPQIVADGEVVVDSVATNREGFLVVHRDDGGQPGEPIGHTAVSPGIYEDVRVGLDQSLPTDGVARLRAVVHADDGDGSFEPGADRPVQSLDGIAGDAFTAKSGDRPVYVLSTDTEAQGANETVRLTEVGVARDGFLVLRTGRGDSGRVVGNVSLSAGIHRNVRVPIDPDAYPERRGFLQLWAVAYADDGDGTFEPGADSPVTVGDRPIQTVFRVQEVPESAVDRSTATATTTARGTSAGDDGTTDQADEGSAGVGLPGFSAVPTVVALAVALVLAAGTARYRARN